MLATSKKETFVHMLDLLNTSSTPHLFTNSQIIAEAGKEIFPNAMERKEWESKLIINTLNQSGGKENLQTPHNEWIHEHKSTSQLWYAHNIMIINMNINSDYHF